MRINPFRPGAIVTPGMFAGRGAELETLQKALYQAKHGNPQHILIHGERGIGKSSLLSFAQQTASGEFPPFDSSILRFNFVPVSICIDPSTTSRGLIGKIGIALAREIEQQTAVKSKLGNVWDFVKRWEVLGVRLHEATATEEVDPLDDLARTITTALKELSHQVDGVVLSIDEADQGAASCELGSFIKNFTERLTALNCSNVALVVSGISSVIEQLRRSHESSVRILSTLYLEPLLPSERLEVLRLGIERANQMNSTHIEIRTDAAAWISKASEGYPHFIQQYAYSAFDTDMDDVIDMPDVITGAHREHGAIDQLGARYFEGMYLDKINSDDYRKVCHVLAEPDIGYISRAEIKARSGLKDGTLTNALGALTKREIIVKHREKPGLYKLPNSSFATWIRARLSKSSPELPLFPNEV